MFKAKKIIISLFLIVFIAMFLCPSVFAAEVDENLVSENLNIWSEDSSSTVSPSISYSNGVNHLVFSTVSYQDFASYFSIPSLINSHTYEFSFKIRGNFNLFPCSVYLQNGNDDSQIFDLTSVSTNLTSDTLYTVSFVPNSSFSFPSNIRIYFSFEMLGNFTSNNRNVYISDISLIDKSPSSPAYSGFQSAITGYISPALSFVNSHINSLFTQIESSWIYLFVWYVLNAGFIIFIVGKSIFDWVDIMQEGTFNLGLNMLRKNKLEKIYNDKREEARKLAEEKYNLRKAERESEFEKRANQREESIQINKQNREKERLALQHYIGGTGSFSNKELAEGYFKKFPNRYSVTISGHKYFNLALLEKAKRDSDNQKSKNDD